MEELGEQRMGKFTTNGRKKWNRHWWPWPEAQRQHVIYLKSMGKMGIFVFLSISFHQLINSEALRQVVLKFLCGSLSSLALAKSNSELYGEGDYGTWSSLQYNNRGDFEQGFQWGSLLSTTPTHGTEAVTWGQCTENSEIPVALLLAPL